MTERLLQFIWQMQYFNKADLHTAGNEPLQIIHAGQLNTNQGPDFREASLKINTTTWVGNIELHVKASDWKLHHHGEDKNYRNIILHVVWEDDLSVRDECGNAIPTLVLEDRVSKFLLQRYEELMLAQTAIPCSGSITVVPELIWSSWKARLVAERLQRKAQIVVQYLKETNGHWEEVFWWMLARNFGIAVNSDAFEAIARSLPVNTLARHKHQIHQLEAFLMGQAGLLDADFEEDYPRMLQKEYRFYRKKYHFLPVHEPVHFLRMRPGNFPTIRLAQLAKLIQQSSRLFGKIKAASALHQLKKMLTVTANDYWHYRYRFDEASSFKEKVLGRQMTDNVVINTIIPVVFAYGHLKQEQAYKTKALQWLEETAAEQNSITRQWTALGLVNRSAYDSQAYIELTKTYCRNKNCLSCAVGAAILKRSV
ncbi:DUF2851 family protein [Agriterribacter sp.]|uniref:DUF2851 family protein n=1 Tax=Agriterribacter sp. TaxID=2821509 RepID=UPI002BB3ABBB|nr:DUF2851 family protein [Agriterribacter sp.]HRO46032.1 DUF2851 family protein [Agriterribacter sp.]HRQ17068.1 DUF2851 family protein [Agriterribacter sp.]